MKIVVAMVSLLALAGGTGSMQGSLMGVPGTVTIPLSVMAALVVFTAFAVWSVMSARRLAGKVVRLRRQTEELTARAHTLASILADSARFNASRNLSDLPAVITAAVADLTGFGKVVLYLWSEVTGAYEARGFAGLSKEEIAALTGLQVRREDYAGLCGSAYRYGSCFLVDSRRGDHTVIIRGDIAAEDWQEPWQLVSPLTTPTGETLGYLTLAEPAIGRAPDPVHTRELEFMAYQSAIALESAQVFDRLARNNADLSVASDKLGSLAEMKANFVANVSHELRTPLTSISAYTELLQTRMETMTDKDRTEFLKVIHKESLKLSEIIDDILEINEMDSGRPGLVQDETDLVSLIRHLEDSWQSRARERDIELVVTTSAPSITLAVDPTMINQMLAKLVSNAFKFNQDGGKVSIALEETGTAVRLVVEDTGIGIPEEELGLIFERFYQVDGSPTREHNGQGLGLAICHDIVTHHDGRIWAENIAPHGARFTVLLPRRAVVHQRTTPETGLRLTVDSGDFVQRVIHWVAESLGVQVVSLLTPDEEGSYLGIRAAVGLPASIVQSVRIRPGQGPIGRAWSTGQSLLIKNVTTDPRFSKDNDEIRYPTPSLLCVPLLADGRTVGVVTVNHRCDGRALNEDDRILVEALAPRISRMMESSRRLRTQAQEFEVMRASLRNLTPVGHLRQESVLDICREICMAAARTIELSETELRHLAFTLRFYDAGMSCVPPQLLNRPGPLDDNEMVFVRRHVQAGLEILDPLLPEAKVRQLVHSHHENYDGSGYPDGLAGEAIPLGARLIRLTDTLTALLSPRPWRSEYSLDDALNELRQGVGREFCPRMAEVFFKETLKRRQRIESLPQKAGEALDLVRPGLDQRGMVAVRP